MRSITDWKLAQKIQASGRRGMIAGMLIAVFVIIAVILVVVKLHWLKRGFAGCDCFDYDDDDYYFDADDLDEDGCAYTSENDFV